jgi:hypothetical protein
VALDGLGRLVAACRGSYRGSPARHAGGRAGDRAPREPGLAGRGRRSVPLGGLRRDLGGGLSHEGHQGTPPVSLAGRRPDGVRRDSGRAPPLAGRRTQLPGDRTLGDGRAPPGVAGPGARRGLRPRPRRDPGRGRALRGPGAGPALRTRGGDGALLVLHGGPGGFRSPRLRRRVPFLGRRDDVARLRPLRAGRGRPRVAGAVPLRRRGARLLPQPGRRHELGVATFPPPEPTQGKKKR